MFQNSRWLWIKRPQKGYPNGLVPISYYFLTSVQEQCAPSWQWNSPHQSLRGTTSTHGLVTGWHSPCDPMVLWKRRKRDQALSTEHCIRFVGWAFGKNGRAKATNHGSPNLFWAMCKNQETSWGRQQHWTCFSNMIHNNVGWTSWVLYDSVVLWIEP